MATATKKRSKGPTKTANGALATKPEWRPPTDARYDFARVPISVIGRNPRNPRQHFAVEQLEELVESIRRHGVLEPVLLRRIEDCGDDRRLPFGGDADLLRYQAIAGERRIRAALLAGLAEVPATVADECDRERAAALAWTENEDRGDLTDIERARGLREMVAAREGQDNAVELVAAQIGRSVSYVRNLLRLLDAPEPWQVLVIERGLPASHLREILPWIAHERLSTALLAEAEKLAADWPSRDRWVEAGKRAVKRATVPIAKGIGEDRITIAKSDPRWKELQTVTVETWGGKEIRAANTQLAAKILREMGRDKQPKNVKTKKEKEKPERKEAERKERINELVWYWYCDQILDAAAWSPWVHDWLMLALACEELHRMRWDGDQEVILATLPGIGTPAAAGAAMARWLVDQFRAAWTWRKVGTAAPVEILDWRGGLDGLEDEQVAAVADHCEIERLADGDRHWSAALGADLLTLLVEIEVHYDGGASLISELGLTQAKVGEGVGSVTSAIKSDLPRPPKLLVDAEQRLRPAKTRKPK